ncbi:MAG TPA: type II secretion system F family protein [bacterium]|jgi:tight adherence protein C|nr:type II secretion system F family protein [bacterium]
MTAWVLLRWLSLAAAAGAGALVALALWSQRQRQMAARRAWAEPGQHYSPPGWKDGWKDLAGQWTLRLERGLPPAMRERLAAWLAAQPQAPRPGAWLLQSLGWGLAGASVGALLQGSEAALGLGLLVLLPTLRLREGAQARLRLLRRALPDALDLLTACVQAGLGLDQALQRVARQLPQGPLRTEWERCLQQLRAGAPRREALLELEARCGLPEFGPVLRAILRSEARGVSLAPVLQAQSAQMRRLRALRLQEKAAQAPVKMLFPLMVFFLPVVFLVVFGPILLKLSETGF